MLLKTVTSALSSSAAKYFGDKISTGFAKMFLPNVRQRYRMPRRNFEGIQTVEIEEGEFKYALIKVSVKTEQDVRCKNIVRGYADCEWHVDIVERITTVCQEMGLEAECLGGGRMEHDPGTRRIRIYHEVTDFGAADVVETRRIVKQRYPEYVIEIGY